MITEKDLQEAIAECQGKRNPDASTCIKLAAFLTIQKEMFGDNEELRRPSYSYASYGPNKIEYNSDTEFFHRIESMDVSDVMRIIDELMTTLQIVNPRLYDGVMRKLTS